MVDYSRFDVVAKDFDDEEKKEKEAQRMENMMRYYKDQEERKKLWNEKHGTNGHGHCEDHAHEQGHGHCDSHGHSHEDCKSHHGDSHSHGHGHSNGCREHGHNHGEHGSGVRKSSSKRAPTRLGCMGCGFADPSRLLEMMEEQKKREAEPDNKDPLMTTEELNKKKLAAVEATCRDGKDLFKKGDYEKARQLYERGVLICNGIYGLSEDEWTTLQSQEVRLNVNIAACFLKMKKYRDAISSSNMALGMDAKCLKAQYRIVQAYMGLGELEKASEELKKAVDIDRNNKALAALSKRIQLAKLKQKQEAAKFTQLMAKKLKLAAASKDKSKPQAEMKKESPFTTANPDSSPSNASTNSIVDESPNVKADNIVDKLQALITMKREGLLSPEEYTMAKRKLIGL